MDALTQQIEKLGGAVEEMGKAHKQIRDQLVAEIEARTDNLGEWPAAQELVNGLKNLKNDQEKMTAQVTELADSVTQYERRFKVLGGEETGASALTRIDPGYYAPNHKRHMPNATAAKALALFVHAVVTKSAKSIERLEELGVELKSVDDMAERGAVISDDEAGGVLLPPEFGGVIIGAMPKYGVAAQYADVETMASNKKTFAKDDDEVEVYALEEGQALTEVEKGYEAVALECKLFGAYTKWSADFDEYGLVNQGEAWGVKFARAIAKRMDQCVFTADGTSTYNNMVGLKNHADVASVSLAGTKTAFTDLDYDKLVDLMAAVPDEIYQEGNCRFFFSSNMLWLLAKLKDGEGRPLYASPTEGITASILGDPIARTAVLPRLSDSASGTKFIGYGDLRRAVKLGVRTQMAIKFSEHARFMNAENVLRVLTRFGSKVTWANAFKWLKTADA